MRINNHTTVWGSWWHDGAWGYACCHSTVKNSYCTGQIGAAAAEAQAHQLAANMEARATEEEARRRESKLVGHKPQADVWGEAPEDVQLDKEKMREALARAERREREGGEADDRKRGCVRACRRGRARALVVCVWRAGRVDWGRLCGGAVAGVTPPAPPRASACRYNSLRGEEEVTPEDMEAYRLKRSRGDDPLTSINAAKEQQQQQGGSAGYDYV